jgi:hypothetical protein
MIQQLREFLKSHHYPADFGATYWLISGGTYIGFKLPEKLG